jgi:hypothetical protein
MTKPTGRPTGRPRKPADPAPDTSVKSTDATDAATLAPGSPEIIAEVVAELKALDPSTFKTAQNFDTAVGKLEFIIAHHKGLQAAQAAAQDKARLDKVPELEETIAALTREALASKKTIDDLKDKIGRLEPRVPSADLWDAQVSRLAAEEKAEQERTDAAAAALIEYKKWDAHRTWYWTLIAQEDAQPAHEEEKKYEKLTGLIGLAAVIQRHGKEDCDGVRSYKNALALREKRTLFLNYATRIRDAYAISVANGETVYEEVKQMEKRRKDDIRTRGLIAENDADWHRGRWHESVLEGNTGYAVCQVVRFCVCRRTITNQPQRY